MSDQERLLQQFLSLKQDNYDLNEQLARQHKEIERLQKLAAEAAKARPGGVLSAIGSTLKRPDQQQQQLVHELQAAKAELELRLEQLRAEHSDQQNALRSNLLSVCEENADLQQRVARLEEEARQVRLLQQYAAGPPAGATAAALLPQPRPSDDGSPTVESEATAVAAAAAGSAVSTTAAAAAALPDGTASAEAADNDVSTISSDAALQHQHQHQQHQQQQQQLAAALAAAERRSERLATELQAAHDKLQLKQESLQALKEEYEQQLASLRADHQAALHDKEAESGRLLQTQAALAGCRDELERERSQRTRREVDTAAAAASAAQAEAASRELATTAAQLASAESELRQAREELREARAACASLGEQAARTAADNAKLKEALAREESARAAAVEDHYAEVAVLRREAEQQAGELQEVRARLGETAQQLHEAQAARDALLVEIEAARAEAAEAAAQLQELKQRHEDEQLEQQVQLKKHAKLVDDLKKQLVKERAAFEKQQLQQQQQPLPGSSGQHQFASPLAAKSTASSLSSLRPLAAAAAGQQSPAAATVSPQQADDAEATQLRAVQHELTELAVKFGLLQAEKAELEERLASLNQDIDAKSQIIKFFAMSKPSADSEANRSGRHERSSSRFISTFSKLVRTPTKEDDKIENFLQETLLRNMELEKQLESLRKY